MKLSGIIEDLHNKETVELLIASHKKEVDAIQEILLIKRPIASLVIFLSLLLPFVFLSIYPPNGIACVALALFARELIRLASKFIIPPAKALLFKGTVVPGNSNDLTRIRSPEELAIIVSKFWSIIDKVTSITAPLYSNPATKYYIMGGICLAVLIINVNIFPIIAIFIGALPVTGIVLNVLEIIKKKQGKSITEEKPIEIKEPQKHVQDKSQEDIPQTIEPESPIEPNVNEANKPEEDKKEPIPPTPAVVIEEEPVEPSTQVEPIMAEDEEEVITKGVSEGNNAHEKYLQGIHLLYGKGVPMDKKEGLRLLREASDEGYADATWMVGWCVSKGWGTAKDDRDGVRLFRKAADDGSSGAACWLGDRYRSGFGVEKNPEEAIRLLQIADEGGYPWAALSLASMYEKGEGVEADAQKATQLRARASELFQQSSAINE